MPRTAASSRFRFVLLVLALLTAVACSASRSRPNPAIHFLELPPAHAGGDDSFEAIKGSVSLAPAGSRIVLYSRDAGSWWVQPFALKPFTALDANGMWQNRIHLGQEYAALLISGAYKPALKLPELPAPGGSVLAVMHSIGSRYVPKILHFSGYEWEARQLTSVRGGKLNSYSAANAWVDGSGMLHLRMTRENQHWMCAEVALTTSLGEGSYTFLVRDLSHLDPSAVVTMYTSDATVRFHREFDIEISRWGRPSSQNAQYVVQPYWEPSNVSRFELPPGRSKFLINWEPDRLLFRTLGTREHAISRHIATSGVPTPGGETFRINFYAFGNSPLPMQHGDEIVIEKFSFLP